MPAVYSTTDRFDNTPLGAELASQTSALTGSLEQLLLEASADCDNFTQRKLGGPPATTVKTTATAGAGSFIVTNCSGIYEGDVSVLGSSGEALEVTGVDVDYAGGAPYDGTVYVNGVIGSGYTASAKVTFYRQCFYKVRGHATGGTDRVGFSMSQEGQMAVAHAGGILAQQSGRIVIVEEYPFYGIQAAYQTLPWGASETLIDLSTALINRSGSVRLPVGFYNPDGCVWRVLYTAGFATAPQDIIDACHLYLADKITRPMNPMGATQIRNADAMIHMSRSAAIAGEAPPTNMYIEAAERKLQRHKRRGFS